MLTSMKSEIHIVRLQSFKLLKDLRSEPNYYLVRSNYGELAQRRENITWI